MNNVCLLSHNGVRTKSRGPRQLPEPYFLLFGFYKSYRQPPLDIRLTRSVLGFSYYAMSLT